jgi:murein DD-endopeptidase MepM/ murein hydrolase activator NlpD
VLIRPSRHPQIALLVAALSFAFPIHRGHAEEGAIAPVGFFARLFHSFPTFPVPGETSALSADGFDLPVNPPNGNGFIKSRGFRAHGHLGEDWGVTGGRGRSLGHPVYSIGNGLVVLARDIRADWGNVVIVRHAWIQNGKIHFADSLYAHLDRITVREGQQVTRGQQIGTIGNNHGMYPPHLHFEIHKDLSIGVNHAQGTRDLRSYWLPTEFIMARRHLGGGGRKVPTPAANFLLPTVDHSWFFQRFGSKKKQLKKSSSSHRGSQQKKTLLPFGEFQLLQGQPLQRAVGGKRTIGKRSEIIHWLPRGVGSSWSCSEVSGARISSSILCSPCPGVRFPGRRG